MSDKNLAPEVEEPQAPNTEAVEKPSKPPMSKTSFEVEPAAAPPMQFQPEVEARPAVKTNGRTAADEVSLGRELLLQVDSYDEAEALLNKRPDLIEQAQLVFGSVVPTTGQNEFVDLTIKAAAEDDPMTLNDALWAKRRQHLNLTGPEVSQLLDFAAENAAKSPLLALYSALLLTDDLTRLEEAGLWKKQKGIVLSTEKTLGLDATALWEEISGPKPAPAPEPVKAETVAAPPQEKKRLAPPLPPVKVKVKKKQRVKEAGPPRWVVAAGFVFLLTMMSCGACALSNLF